MENVLQLNEKLQKTESFNIHALWKPKLRSEFLDCNKMLEGLHGELPTASETISADNAWESKDC